jgi:hypothetical protein
MHGCVGEDEVAVFLCRIVIVLVHNIITQKATAGGSTAAR